MKMKKANCGASVPASKKPKMYGGGTAVKSLKQQDTPEMSKGGYTKKKKK